MEIQVTCLTADILARIVRMAHKDTTVLLEKYGRKQAISEGVAALAREIREHTTDQDNHHLLFTQFKRKVCGDSPEIFRHGKEIQWRFETNLFAMASEHNIDVPRLFGVVVGYMKEIFEELFDALMEVQLSPQAPQNMITMTIFPFDESKQWIQTILTELGKLDTDRAITMLEQCGRACGRSHGLTELSKEIRDDVGDTHDIDGLFLRYKEKVYHNSPRLYQKNGTMYLEYHACGCPIVKEKAIDNPLFCNCTRGYTKERFETLFDLPVHVELIECILRGDTKCKQAITINKN